MAAMRDVFLNCIYDYAKNDPNIIVLSDDFSAPATDQFKINIPQQYQFVGISEQNMMLVATGLALEGKRVFCYAIAPFLTMRCFEQTRLYASGMNLPITLVGVGAGISYVDSGYTHHAVEDISIMRSLPHMKIMQPCDNKDTAMIAEYCMQSNNPIYVRLDRYGIDSLYKGERDIKNGISIIEAPSEITLMASGSMIKIALEIFRELHEQDIDVGVINIETIPYNREKFVNLISNVKYLITMEEHSLIGGLGSYVCEIISDLNLEIKIKRIGFDLSNGYIDEFGGRDFIYQLYKMDKDSIIKLIKEYKYER